MSYALVPVERYHPVVRLPRGTRLLRPRWAAAGLGASDLGAATIGVNPGDMFYWSPDGWYFTYAWAPGLGWDVGRWYRGSELCDAAKARNWHVSARDVVWSGGSSAVAQWFAIWSDTLKRFAYFAPIDEVALCHDDIWAYASGHTPGAVVS